MAISKISVRNMIEVNPGPSGGNIDIPSNESPSIHSSYKLSEEMNERGFYGTTISVNKALELVPGSRIVFVPNSGGGKGVLMRFFEFPPEPAKVGSCESDTSGGPSPSCPTDWYQLLRDNADGIEAEDTADAPSVDQICSAFSFRHKDSDIL